MAACSTSATPGGAGAECFQATDCAQGLVCLPPSCNGGKQICGSDLTCVQSMLDAGVESSAFETGPPPEGAPPADSPPPTDTGTPPQDTGSPPMDTGSPPQDTGSPPQDTGSPPPPDSSAG